VRAGCAIVIAVALCKPLLFEVYRIPSASMQPALMGPDAGAARDLVLVDKLRWSLGAPRRWELVAFRYPLCRTELHVKRIVGLPGETLRIAGGNVWLVEGGEARVLAKPPALQEHCWREIYPMRARLAQRPFELAEYFAAHDAACELDGETLVFAPHGDAWAELAFTNPTEGGLVDRLYDGYPLEVARVLQERAGRGVPFEGVQDARWSCTLTAARAPCAVRIALTIRQAGRPDLELALALDGAGGALIASEGGVESARARIAAAIDAGVALPLSFAHVDGLLLARAGAQRAQLDVAAFGRTGPLRPGDATLSLHVRGGDRVRLADLRIERDLHHLPDGLIGGERLALTVPAAHCFVLGDNPRESLDGRGWRGVEVGILPDGRAVDPDRESAAARRRGALAHGASSNPERIDAQRVSFTDLDGNVVAMRAALDWRLDGGEPALELRAFDERGQPGAAWQPRTFAPRFVPQGALIGRPFLAGPLRPRWLR
jgi:signal peptidase I